MLGFYLADARAVYVPVVDLIYSVALYNTENFLAHLIAPNAGVMQKGKYRQARFSAAERDNSSLPASRCKIFGSGLSSKNQPRVPATAYPSHTAQLLKIKSMESNLLSSKNSLNFFEVLHHSRVPFKRIFLPG